MTNVEKLYSKNGLCTSIAKTDFENAEIIKLILEAHVKGSLLQSAKRSSGKWEDLTELPMEFVNYQYRVKQ